MSQLRDDISVKVSTEAAQVFVDFYYHALQNARHNLASFYMPSSAMPDGEALPVIVYNGNVIPDATAMQRLFHKEMPNARYEVQDYDCQVLNPHYVVEGAKSSSAPASGKNMTILVTVSGYVKYGEPRTATMRGFSENFILTPNPATAGGNTRNKHLKDWLIQSQNFRLVV